MSSSEDSYISDTSSEGTQIYNVATAAVLVARLKAAVANAAPVDATESAKRTKVQRKPTYVS